MQKYAPGVGADGEAVGEGLLPLGRPGPLMPSPWLL